MIVYVTTRGHERTLHSLTRHTFGFPTPHLIADHYDRLMVAARVPRATYVFADLERLYPWELKLAANLFRDLSTAGLRCLNDPAMAMSRVELLRSLHAAGINPFSVMRGDELPRPVRFPVFLRFEADHEWPLLGLIENQQQLDESLSTLRTSGVPLRGIIVIEHFSAPYSPGLWHKWGTFRVGNSYSVDHLAVDDNWCVKYGVWEKLTNAAIAEEHEAVSSNRFASDLMPPFNIAHIDFGRADHAVVGGRTVIYEINTNPYIGPYVPDPHPLRRETQEIARRRFADALADCDTERGGFVRLRTCEFRDRLRQAWKSGLRGPTRP